MKLRKTKMSFDDIRARDVHIRAWAKDGTKHKIDAKDPLIVWVWV